MNHPAIAKLCALLAALAALAVALLFTPMPAAHATPAVTTWTVTDSGDGAATPGNCPGTGCRLRDALAASALGDTIVFSLTYPATITRLLPGSFSITHSVTISGPGASNLAVSGNNTGRVFLIGSTGLTVTISGLTIKDGSVPSSTGGGISNAGVLTLTDSVVFSNTASFGGGIHNSGSMSVTNTSVISNSAPGGFGGGIDNTGFMTVTNTTAISSNTAEFSGGGIYNSGSMTVISTMVISNTTTGASGAGGGIYSLGTFTLTGVTVRGNTATDGGGLYPGGPMRLDSSSVISNTAESNGGGIRNSAALTIANSAILSNTATTQLGGGIYNAGGSVFITNTTLSGNSAPLAAGGGIYNLASGSVQLTNVTIANNNALSTTNGGGVRNLAGPITLKNTIVANNSSRNCLGTITSLGNNLENANDCGLAASGDITSTSPFLGALANNGGPTLTHALLPGSPAINAGNNSGCPPTDQRGAPRPRTAANRCDIGAFEAWYLFLPLIIK